MTENNNNKAHLIGTIKGGFTFSHAIRQEKFYLVSLEVKRLSDQTDIIQLMISERLINVEESYNGCTAKVFGQFRSFNKHGGDKDKVILFLFVQKIRFVEELPAQTNQIFLDGYICKTPIYRKTPMGREIADIILAVNRLYGKADYIPCIAWGRDAVYASSLNVGDHLQIEGRIQSREYQKRISETETETRTAYEVSISRLETMEN